MAGVRWSVVLGALVDNAMQNKACILLIARYSNNINQPNRSSKMNATRKQAQKAYEAALEKLRFAESGTNLEAWEKASADLAIARTALIEAEASNPTAVEVKRANRKLWLRNIGMDV